MRNVYAAGHFFSEETVDFVTFIIEAINQNQPNVISTIEHALKVPA